MNRELFFWNRWLPTYRWLFVSLLVLLGAALTIYLIQYFVGADAVIGWNVVNQLQDVNLTLESFTRGIFNFTVQAPSFLVLEWFEATDMRTNHAATYAYGVLTALGLAWLLAVVPSLPRWWYLGSMMAFIGLVVSLQTDVLQVAGLTNWVVPGVTLAVFLPVSYWFHAFRPDISVAVRLAVFAVLITTLVAFWAIFAKSPLPVMSVLAYGTRAMALLTVLFIILVSVEVPAALLSLITGSGVAAGRNSIFHFSVITLFYVGNLVVAYLNNSGLVEWNFLYVNAFYLLAVSVVLGIWSFRRRIDDLLSDPYGVMLYGGWAVLALGTIGYSFATGNDPMADLYEDTIVYSHLAMGVAFFLYVYVNFRGPMAQGLPVHKIVYQPRIMPFGLALALAGLIMLVLLLRVSMFPFNQGVAGYHNYLGDLYFAQGQDVLAETYYKKALLFQESNHKSNYALASIARRHDNPEAMAAFLKQAIANKPTPHTYAALSQLYSREDLFFDALFTLREGGELLHNMAVIYDRTRLSDSAYYFYQRALPHVKRPETVQTNLLALWAKLFSGPQLDSVLNAAPVFDDYAYQNNRLAISNLLRKTDAQPYLPVGEAAITRTQFAYLYNYTLNQRSRPDSTAAHTINKLSENPNNANYGGYLGFARAVWLYQNRQT
ncbi:MAG: hypothetical protein MUD08_19140, partial [Cytophagales bacterium]|nr:hypothetical protein [Cytophagales bacterium]